jgi:hypothetical protein
MYEGITGADDTSEHTCIFFDIFLCPNRCAFKFSIVIEIYGIKTNYGKVTSVEASSKKASNSSSLLSRSCLLFLIFWFPAMASPNWVLRSEICESH